MLRALAHILGIPIIVHQLNARALLYPIEEREGRQLKINEVDMEDIYLREDAAVNGALHISFHNNNHYNSVNPLNVVLQGVNATPK